MKLRECFRRRNNPRRVGADEEPAKSSDQVGAGDGVVASAAVAAVDKDVKSKDELSFRSLVPVS